MILGLTGLYCAGKNHVGALLEKRGFPVLDADALGHRVLDEKAADIAALFGADLVDDKGRVLRRELGARVFGQSEKLAALEGIVHPAVNALTDAWLEEKAGAEIRVINAALLHRSSAWKRLGAIILVRAPLPVRLLRGLCRDSLPIGDLLRRFSSQKGFEAQYFSEKTDIYTVDNSGFPGSGKTLEKRIELICKGLV